MNWPGSNKAPQPPPLPPADGQGPEKGRSALPPQCPRCEVTKAQFNRTIQNYQKAYRKKVEGLKTELKATRNTNDALRKQVKDLQSIIRLHIPSILLGLGIGVAAKTYSATIKKLFSRKGKQATEAAQDETQAEGSASAAQP